MKFPYSAWVLTPSFKTKQIQIPKESFRGGHWLYSETGKCYAASKVYHSKEDAIHHGQILLQDQQLALNQKQLNINKRRAALEKAAGEAKP